MSTTQEEDRIQPANKLQKPSPQIDSSSQAQAANPIYPPPDALPKSEPVPVPIKDPVYVIPLERLGEQPADIDCPFCHQRTRTRVEHVGSCLTWYVTPATSLSILLALNSLFSWQQSHRLATMFCLWTTCYCFFIPICCGWCQDTNHYCSECNKQVTHKPYSDDRANVVIPLQPKALQLGVPSIHPVEQVPKGA